MGSTEAPTSPQPRQVSPQEKEEFYGTYDVMTGVRIAGTLGGFFGLMVLLVVYKSKCKSRSVSEEGLEAAVAAAEAVGGVALWAPHYAPSFFPPPRPPTPPPANTCLSPHIIIQEEKRGKLLTVPERRPSSVTCSSCDTSYLERRGSALELGLPIPPPFTKPSSLIEETWDFYYPIDIQVIQPTPQISPSQSQNSVYEWKPGLLAPAPLASISSILPMTEQDNHSLGSDSVFLDEELIDTEDEVEGFSTDSDAENMECALPSTMQYSVNKQTKILPQPILVLMEENRVPVRRFSSPSPSMKPNNIRENVFDRNSDKHHFCSKSCNEITLKTSTKTSSESDTVCANNFTDIGSNNLDQYVGFISQPNMSVSCDHLVKALQEHSMHSGSSKSIVEHCTWSQETLF